MTGIHVTDSINTRKSRIGDQASGILQKKSDISDFCMRPYVEYEQHDDGTFFYRVVKRPY